LKRIIICADGTWNKEEGMTHLPISNVLKIARSIEPIGADGVPQIVYYDEGVGTGWSVDRVIGGATGFGISKNIQEAYRFIVNNYTQGDELCCVGFSRGAYTVRSVGGLIALFNQPQRSDMTLLDTMYDYYRTAPVKRANHPMHQQMQHVMATSKPVRVKVMAVFDTVGSLGFPTPILNKISRKYWVGFHDTTLRNTDYAYQALAIDERRGPFSPSVWSDASDAKEVKQVWFSGVHSNVGGGYEDTGLSDIALEWMIAMLKKSGLAFDDAYLQNYILKPDINGTLYHSKGWGYRLLNYLNVPDYFRPLAQTHQGSTGVNERIHHTAVSRFDQGLLGWNAKHFSYGVAHLDVEQ